MALKDVQQEVERYSTPEGSLGQTETFHSAQEIHERMVAVDGVIQQLGVMWVNAEKRPFIDKTLAQWLQKYLPVVLQQIDSALESNDAADSSGELSLRLQKTQSHFRRILEVGLPCDRALIERYFDPDITFPSPEASAVLLREFQKYLDQHFERPDIGDTTWLQQCLMQVIPKIAASTKHDRSLKTKRIIVEGDIKDLLEKIKEMQKQ